MSKGNQKYVAGVLALAACIALILAFSGHTPVEGQHLGLSQADNSFTDNITEASDSAAIPLQGAGAVSCYVSGTFSATLKPQLSYDGGTTWVDTQFYDVVDRQYDETITAAASRFILGCAGASHARVVDNAGYSSGTAVVVMRRTMAPVAPDPIRDISMVKGIADSDAGSTNAEVIWTPAAGKKIRIFKASIQITASTTMTLVHSAAGTVLAQWAPSDVDANDTFEVDFGPKGYLIDTADATVALTRSAAATLGGYICGREEDPTP